MPGQSLNVFNVLSKHLASNGIASLRFDKRGCGKSSGDFKTAGHVDHIADVTAWIEYLEQCDFCAHNQLFLLGHSEGSIIAPQLSLKHPSIAGIILLSPFVQNMESILRQQAARIKEAVNKLDGFIGRFYRFIFYLTGDPVKSQNQIIEKIKVSTTPTIRYKFRTLEAKWLRELLRLEPSEIFRQVICPVLLIGGEKDVQCNPADVEQISKLLLGDVEKHVVPNLTHILRFDTGSHTIFRYKELIKNPVEECVLDMISNL